MTNARFGTINHNGKTLTLTQQAYLHCDGSDTGERYYRASAVDAEGNDYRVRWELYEGFDGEDESEACDWDSPSEIVEL